MTSFLTNHLFAPLFASRVNTVCGFENLPVKGPFIIVANHVSYLDPPLIGALVIKRTKEKPHFITKPEIYRVFGKLIGKRWLGMIPFDRRNKKKCLEVALNYLEQKKIVGLFPEGTRILGKELRKGKTGAARLALWSKCPVIPIGFIGPAVKSIKDTLRVFFSKKQEIKIEIGRPLDLSKFYHQEITYDLLEEVTSVMLQEIAKLSDKPYSH